MRTTSDLRPWQLLWCGSCIWCQLYWCVGSFALVASGECMVRLPACLVLHQQGWWHALEHGGVFAATCWPEGLGSCCCSVCQQGGCMRGPWGREGGAGAAGHVQCNACCAMSASQGAGRSGLPCTQPSLLVVLQKGNRQGWQVCQGEWLGDSGPVVAVAGWCVPTIPSNVHLCAGWLLECMATPSPWIAQDGQCCWVHIFFWCLVVQH